MVPMNSSSRTSDSSIGCPAKGPALAPQGVPERHQRRPARWRSSTSRWPKRNATQTTAAPPGRCAPTSPANTNSLAAEQQHGDQRTPRAACAASTRTLPRDAPAQHQRRGEQHPRRHRPATRSHQFRAARAADSACPAASGSRAKVGAIDEQSAASRDELHHLVGALEAVGHADHAGAPARRRRPPAARCRWRSAPTTGADAVDREVGAQARRSRRRARRARRAISRPASAMPGGRPDGGGIARRNGQRAARACADAQ